MGNPETRIPFLPFRNMTTTHLSQTRLMRHSIDLESGLSGEKKTTTNLTLQNCKRILYAAGAVILLITVLGYESNNSPQHRRLADRQEFINIYLRGAWIDVDRIQNEPEFVTALDNFW